MTSPGPYIEVWLWDDTKEAGRKDASSLSSMEAFRSSAGLRPQTVHEFCRYVYYHLCVTQDPRNFTKPIDLDRYVIVDISIFKQPYSLQHESILFHLQATSVIPDHDPEDFCILADRNTDAATLLSCTCHANHRNWHPIRCTSYRLSHFSTCIAASSGR